MYHPFVDDQVYRIERQFRERQAAMARMARQLDAGRPGIWGQLRTRFQQVWARAAILLIPSPFPPTPRLAIRGSKRHRIEASPDGQSCPLAYDRGVEPQAAAMVQEEVLPITPITTEILAKIHRDELEHVAEQERALHRVLQSASGDRQNQTISPPL